MPKYAQNLPSAETNLPMSSYEYLKLLKMCYSDIIRSDIFSYAEISATKNEGLSSKH